MSTNEQYVFKTDFVKTSDQEFIAGMYMIDVTRQAKNTLGEDVVDEAWYEVIKVHKDHNEIEDDEYREVLDYAENSYREYVKQTDKSLNLLMSEIFIKLNSGRILRLWASEWGGLQEWTKENRND